MTNREISEKLRSSGVMPSALRIAIYRTLDENRIHPSADEVYALLAEDNPTLSKTTVYNTLKTFNAAGLTQHIIIENGELRYDADTSGHAHFKCLKCGKVFDLFFDPGEYLPPLDSQFTVKSIHLNYHGFCSGCLLSK